jgi:small GTP-binding protein
MIVYDMTKETTFESLEKWYNKLVDSADQNIVMMVCGNKSDLIDERKVSKEQGEAFAKEKEVLFLETSALDSTNVEAAFL